MEEHSSGASDGGEITFETQTPSGTVLIQTATKLHAEDTPTGAIAAFSRGGIDPSTKVYIHDTLALTARAHEINELCVVSFLFLEKWRRLEEREEEKQGMSGSMEFIAGINGVWALR